MIQAKTWLVAIRNNLDPQFFKLVKQRAGFGAIRVFEQRQDFALFELLLAAPFFEEGLICRFIYLLF